MTRTTQTLAALLVALGTLPAVAQTDTAAATPETGAEAETAAEAPGPIITATGTSPEDWLWLKRPVLVFADSPNDPRYVQQMDFIQDRIDALEDRDVIVITDTDPAARSEFRQKMRPRGFMLAVLAKDGTVVTRKPSPWDVREISRSIDKLPLRIQEVRDRVNAGS